MKRMLLALAAGLMLGHAFAGKTEHACSGQSFYRLPDATTHVKDSALLEYDVSFYGIDLEVSDTSTFVRGSTQIRSTALERLDEAVFELSVNLTVDSVHMDGMKVPAFAHGNDLIRITAPAQIEAGQAFSTRIFYHGSGGRQGFFSGISNRRDPFWEKVVTYTLSEPFHALDWFACKQVLTDKADSAYIYLTVPDHLKAGSNGLLAGIDSLPGNRARYRWETRYPVAFYLLSLSVSEYMDYSYYLHPEQSTDSFLFQNYIYDTVPYLASFKEDIDATGDMMLSFTRLFGDYPFRKEKYGHCLAPMGGGMEHQTMTTLANFGYNLVAHELAHQWFGDHVTCASWQDIWINEGFASYAEYLALEYGVSKGEADGWMEMAHDRVFTEPEGSVFIPEEEAKDEFRIFSNALSYKKGAALLHMIRYELNDDSVFFRTLQNFQKEFDDSVARGDDFLAVLNETSGRTFEWFFEQWYYGQGYPEFNLTWWQTTDSLYVAMEQKGSSQATPFFRTSLDLGLAFENGQDSILRVIYDRPVKSIQVPLNRRVLDLTPDPANWIVDVSHVVRRSFTPAYLRVHPNPFGEQLNIVFNDGGAMREILLTDMNGRLVDRVSSDSWMVSIPTRDLAPGVYLLKVLAGKDEYSTKVVRQ